MAATNKKTIALLPLAIAPIVVGVISNGGMDDAFGLSGDFWTGTLMGSGIGLLVIMIVLGLRSARTS